jgi:hypothetical protein
MCSDRWCLCRTKREVQGKNVWNKENHTLGWEDIHGIFLIPCISSAHSMMKLCEPHSQVLTLSLQLCVPLQQEPATSLQDFQDRGDIWPWKDPTVLCRRIDWKSEWDPMADSKMEDTFWLILSCQGQLRWAQCLIDSMSWPSVRWGGISYSEVVVNEYPISIFREGGAHIKPATCGGQLTFLWGWWCDIYMLGNAWLQCGHVLYLSIFLGAMGADAMTQVFMVLRLVIFAAVEWAT